MIRSMVVASVGALVLAVVGAPPAARQTHHGPCHAWTIQGTRANDILIGTDGRDVIRGRRGDDVIVGLKGNDRLCGNRGDDTLNGGPGRDDAYGQRGSDFCLQTERTYSCERH